jgi:hypothetical protein
MAEHASELSTVPQRTWCLDPPVLFPGAYPRPEPGGSGLSRLARAGAKLNSTFADRRPSIGGPWIDGGSAGSRRVRGFLSAPITRTADGPVGIESISGEKAEKGKKKPARRAGWTQLTRLRYDGRKCEAATGPCGSKKLNPTFFVVSLAVPSLLQPCTT